VDLSLFLAVLWRSKPLLLAGFVLGLVLAALAYGTPKFSGGLPTLAPRTAEVWQSESQLLITQADYPYGQNESPPQTSLASLSPVYATLANGAVVQSEIHKNAAGTPGKVKAGEAVDVATSSGLPFVNLVATAPTREDAERLATVAGSTFQTYVARQQALARIAPRRRVQLSAVLSAGNTKLIEGHKLSIPILVFVAVLIAIVSLIFLKENLQPRAAAHLHRLGPSVGEAPPVDEAPPIGGRELDDGEGGEMRGGVYSVESGDRW
jgi:capsular polysaccharide biosynthesis protein